MGFIVLGLIILIAGIFASAASKKDKDNNVLPILGKGMMVVGGLAMLAGLMFAAGVVVKSGYVGVRLRFGAVNGQLTEGFHLIMPGIDEVVLIEVRTQKDQSQAGAASRDLQTVRADIALNYRVDPAQVGKLYSEVGTQYKARIIDPAIQEAIKVASAKYSAEDLIRQREKVKYEVEEIVTKRLSNYYLIVEPGGLSITNFEFSEEFNRAIESKQVAQQEAEKQKYVLQQAELEQQTRIARAKGEAEAAKLNAESLKAQGGALVVAREWIAKWDGQLPQVSGGGSQGGGFILDLKSLLDQTKQ